jgi:hypothetical protein
MFMTEIIVKDDGRADKKNQEDKKKNRAQPFCLYSRLFHGEPARFLF